jgi:Flp pilus assembly protein TadD
MSFPSLRHLLAAGLALTFIALPAIADATSAAAAPPRALEGKPPLSAEERKKLLASADALFGGGSYDGAVSVFDSLLERDPADEEALRGKGYCLYFLHRDAEAEALAKRLMTAHPQNPDGPLLLGQLALQYGHIDEAKQLFTLARDVKPADPDAARHLAEVLAISGQLQNARSVLKRSREAVPAGELGDTYALSIDLAPTLTDRIALMKEMQQRYPKLAQSIGKQVARLEAIRTGKSDKLASGWIDGPGATLQGKAEDGGWRLKGMINHKPVTLRFASGSPYLVLTPAAITRLKLAPAEVLRSAGGGPLYLLDSLSLDKLNLAAVPAVPAGGAIPGGPGGEVDGIFGLSLLRDFVVRMFPLEAKLEILPESTPPQVDNNSTPLYFDGGVPLVEVQFDGQGPFLMNLDTGAPAAALNRLHLDRFKLSAERSLLKESHDFGFSGLTLRMPSVPVYPLNDGQIYHMGLVGVANLPPVFEVRANKGYISYPTMVPLPKTGSAPAVEKAKPPVKDKTPAKP